MALGDRLRDRVRSLRRDASFVLGRVRGARRSPLIDRPTRVARTTGLMRERTLRVTRRVQETPDAVTLVLEDPTGARLDYRPGQFLTVLVEVAGEPLRRAYSLSGAALPGRPPQLTIKRMPGGRVSGLMHELREGASLRVLGPSGDFTVSPDPGAARELVLVAGGSGITPIACIAETLLAREPDTTLALLYGNRSARDVIFRERLDALAGAHPGRLRVVHVLEEPPADHVGRLDAATVATRLDALSPGADARYFVCGPTPMMDAVRDCLSARGVTPDRIHEERFSRPEQRVATAASSEPQRVVFRVAGRDHPVVVDPGETLLDAALSAGVELPYSCAMGGCGACRVRVTSGEVALDEPNCLSADERAAGWALTCVGRAVGAAAFEVGS